MSITSDILQKLQTVSTESGKDFLELSNSFPVLIKELEDATSNGTQLQDFEQIIQELHTAVEKQSVLLERNRKFLNDFKNKNNDLFKGISDKIHLLDTIQDIILGIKDESENMEVISLNAMVVSIRSGKEGQAFSYITANLKQSSKRLIKQSDALIQYENTVQSMLKELETEIQEVNTLNTQSASQEKVENSEIISTATQISDTLHEMLRSSRTIKNPILKAMEGIQIQDIIRQSLDDILLAVEKIHEPDSSLSPEKKLEQFTTNKKLLQLSVRCLNGVKKNLDSSIELFTTNRNTVNKTLSDLEDSRTGFLNGVNGEESSLKVLHSCINKTIENFNMFTHLIQSYQQIQSNVLKAVKNIQDSVSEMSACFTAFGPIISNLQYVAIAQRIEVARNEAISSIKDTVEHMAQLIAQTQENVQTAQNQLQDFTDTCNSEIKKFLDASSRDDKNFYTVSKEKDAFASELDKIYYALDRAAANFSVYSPDFYTNYTSISGAIDRLHGLSRLIIDTQQGLQHLLDNTERERNALITNHQLEDTGIHNLDIIEFLNHFTITADKQEAGSLAGIAVSHGATSGDITFF
ncbi:MAG: hypothetical protein IJA53_08640 [Spirochaetaceae bacterium]|nr:hypothetical protein [Spirochaetaceae bacterium]